MRIGGFLPFTLSDYPGRPASMVFVQGCNYRCPYCHNPSLLAEGPGTLAEEDILGRLRRRTKVMPAVVVSGGEPTLQDDLPDFCHRLRTLGLRVKLDTNGSRPVLLETLLAGRLVDYVAMDVKAPWRGYGWIGGQADGETAARSAALIAASGVEHHFRTTFDRSRLTQAQLDVIRAALPAGSTYVIQPCRTPRPAATA